MPGPTLDDLPLDIKLRIVESCELTGLIKLRCASRPWRNLVMETDISLLNPTRRALLDLYDLALDSKWFQHSRRHIIPDVQHFDRNQYIEDLPGTSVPEEFEMWIREWPEKAVIGWLWPGLEDWAPSFDKPDDEWWRMDARNHLSAEFVEEFRDIYESGREHTKCSLFVDRELPPAHQAEEQQPDIEATAIQVQFAYPNESYGQDPQDPMGSDPLGNVMLILSNGGRFDGTVQYRCSDTGTKSLFPNIRPPKCWAPSWIEFLRDYLGALEQLYMIHERRLSFESRLYVLEEYWFPSHKAHIHTSGTRRPDGQLHVEETIPEPSKFFKMLLPIHRANGVPTLRAARIARS